MKILALETSGYSGSVAALDDGRLLAEQTLPAEQRSAQSLAPAIRDLLAQIGWRPVEVELVAVGVGPGSFTGLRVGVTTAKTLAYAIGAQVIGVNTLQAIATRAPRQAGLLSAVIDAQRQEVFAADFTFDADGRLVASKPTRILSNDAWFAELSPGATVTGPALEKLGDRLPAHVTPLAREIWQPTPAAIGQLAWQAYRAGQRDDVFSLLPQYFRRTAAEEQWEKKQQLDSAV